MGVVDICETETFYCTGNDGACGEAACEMKFAGFPRRSTSRAVF